MSDMDIGKMSLELALESGNFSQKMSAINKEIKNLDREFKTTGNSTKGFEGSLVGLNSKMQKSANQINLYNKKLDSQKKEYEKLNNALDRQKSKLNELENTLGKSSSEYKKQQQLIQQTASKMSTLGSKITQTQSNLQRLGNQLNDATREMEQLNNKSLTVEQRLSNVGRQATLAESQFNRLQSELSGTGNFIQRLGNDMERLSSQIQQNVSRIQIYENEIQRLGNELQQNSARQLQLATSIQQTEDELQQVSSLYGRTSTEAQQLSSRLLGLRDDFNRNEQEIEQNSNALNRYQSELNDTQARVNRLGNELRQMPFNRIGNQLRNTGSSIKSAGMDMFQYVTLPLLAAGGASTKAAIDIESAFAGVKKTMDTAGLTAEQADARFETLTNGIMELSKRMPASAVEIAGVAEAAGQLGIKTENILRFTETMVMLGDATNLSSDEAATALARLANITGMPQTEFDKLGSTIVALGNNMATTEAEITAMGLRLAGAGSQVGMSEAEIMSFSAALSSVGIEAEAGGSAFSKVMVEMQLASEKGGESLDNFAKVAGMSSDEFSKAFKDNAPQAIMAFIEGLGTAEERGLSAIGILDEMGISEVRLRDTLLRASGASDVFSEALKIGSQAWEENNALANEANQRYETTESKLKIAKNRLIETGKAIGEKLIPVLIEVVDCITDWTEKFNELDDSQQQSILKMAGFAAAIAPVLIGLGSIMMVGGNAVLVFGAMKSALSGAAAGTGIIAKALGLLSAGAIPIAIAAVLGLIGIIGESENTLDFLQDKFGILGLVIGTVCEHIAGVTQLTFGNLILFVTGGAKAIGAIMKGEFWKVDDIVSETWANVENNTAKALSNIAADSSTALNLLGSKTKEELSNVEKTFDIAMKHLPKMTNDNIGKVAKVFAKNLSSLDQDSLTILKGTSDNMAILFEGISEGMDNDKAVKKFTANLESMNKGGKLDGLEADISKAMDLINRNISDGSTQVKQDATDMFNSIKESSKIGMDGAVSNVVGQLGNMNQETLTELMSFGATWKDIFKGVKLDSSMSTEQMKNTILSNIKTMGLDSEQLINQLRQESSNHWKSMEQDAQQAGNTLATSFDQVPSEVIIIFKNNGITAEQDVLNLYNALQALPKELVTYILTDGSKALEGAKTVDDVLKNIPEEKLTSILTELKSSGDMKPEQLQGILDKLPTDKKTQIVTKVNGKEEVKKAKEDIDKLPAEKKTDVKVETGNSKQKVEEVKKNVESVPDSKTTTVKSETSQASKNVTGYKKNLDDFEKKHTGKTKITKFDSKTATASKGVTGLKTNISNFVSRFCKTFTTTFKVVTSYVTQGTPSTQSSGTKPGGTTKSIAQPKIVQQPIAFRNDMTQPQASPMMRMMADNSQEPQMTAMADTPSVFSAPSSNLVGSGGNIFSAFKSNINLLTELDNKIKILTNSMTKLDSEYDDAIGDKKIEYLNKQNSIISEQVKQQKVLEENLIRQKNYFEYFLKNKGFTFDSEGNTTNFNDKIMSMEKYVNSLEQASKKAQDASSNADSKNESAKKALEDKAKKAQEAYDKEKEKLDDVTKYLTEYTKVQLDELPKCKDEWNKLNNSIKDHQQEIKKLQNEKWQVNHDAYWLSIYRDVEEVNNQLEMLDVLLKNAFGKDKLDLMDQQIELLHKQKKELGDTIDFMQGVRNELTNKLKGFGFEVRDNGTIGNFIQQMNKLKATSEDFDEAEKVVKEYFDLINNKIPDTEKQIKGLDNTIKNVYRSQLSVIKDMKGKITEVYKKQLEERKKLIEEELKKKTDALNKEKKAYNDARKEVDYQRDYQDQLDAITKLQKQLDIAQRDSSLIGQKKQKDLLDKIKDEQRKLDDLVQSKIDENVNNMFDSEVSSLDKQAQDSIKSLEEKFSDSKVAKLVAESLSTGMFEGINGQMTSLQEKMLEYTDKFGDGLSICGNLIKTELVDNLQMAQNTMKDLDNIMSELGAKKFNTNVDYSSSRFSKASQSNTTNNNDNRLTVNFNKPLVEVKGDMTKDVLPEVESMIKKAQKEITKNIVKNYKF